MGAIEEEGGGLEQTLQNDAQQAAGKISDGVNTVKDTVNDVRKGIQGLKDLTENNKGHNENNYNNANNNVNNNRTQQPQNAGQQTKDATKQGADATKQGAEATKQGAEATKQGAEATKQAADTTKQIAETTKEATEAAKEAVEATVDATSEAIHTTTRIASDAATLGAAEAVNAPMDAARRTTKGAAKATKEAGKAAAKSAKAAQEAAHKLKEEAQKEKTKKLQNFMKKHPILFLIIAGFLISIVLTQAIAYFFLKPFMNGAQSVVTERTTIETKNVILAIAPATGLLADQLMPMLLAKDALSLQPLTPEYPSMVAPEVPVKYISREGYEDVNFAKALPDYMTAVQLYIDDAYTEAKTDFPEWVGQGRGKKAYCPIPDPIDYELTWNLFLQQTYHKPDRLSVLCAATMKVPEFQADKTRELLSELAKHERFKYDLLDRNMVHEDMYLNVIYHYPPDQDSQFIWDYYLVPEYDDEGHYVGDRKVWFKRFYAIPEFVSPANTPEKMLKLFEMDPDAAYSKWHGEQDYPAGTKEFDSNEKHYKYVKHIYEEILKTQSGVSGSFGYGGGYSIGSIHGGSLSDTEIQAYVNSATGISGNRKQILQVALSVVGAIDYEWGGGHDHFGTHLEPGWNNVWGTTHWNDLINNNAGGMHVAGLDCSGFVRWVTLTASGEDTMNTTCAGLGGRVAREISFAELQPGDIGWNSGHVGIYLGNGSWVHAPGDGQKVSIAESDGPYQFNRFGTIPGSDGSDWWKGFTAESADLSGFIPQASTEYGFVQSYRQPSNESGAKGTDTPVTAEELQQLYKLIQAEGHTMGVGGMRLLTDQILNTARIRGTGVGDYLYDSGMFETVRNGADDAQTVIYEDTIEAVNAECFGVLTDDRIGYYNTQQAGAIKHHWPNGGYPPYASAPAFAYDGGMHDKNGERVIVLFGDL